MESGGCSHKVVFEKDGVFLHTSAKKQHDRDAPIPGVIRIIEKDIVPVLEWVPVEESGDVPHIVYSKKESTTNGVAQTEEEIFDPGYEPDWAVISTVKTKSQSKQTTQAAAPLSNPGSREKWSFSLELSELKSIRKSKPGLGWSFLIFITKEGVSVPALHFHSGGTSALLKALSQYVSLFSSPKDPRLYLVCSRNSYPMSHSFDGLQLYDEGSADLVLRFFQDPYSATFGSFSKVTNFFRGALKHPEATKERPLSETAVGLEDEPGFEVITCQADIGQRPTVQRDEAVTEQVWQEHFDPEGRVKNVEDLKAKIFQGGLIHGIRKEVWKFLLRYYPWDSTIEERKQLVKRKTDEYFRMKLQWKSVSEEQEKRNSLLRGYRSLIERDVSRTDRSNKFYEGSDNPGLTLMNDVLMTYCMYNFDLGYVQGMSDLLSPILFVMQNEVEAFWCLAGFMELVHRNFEESQEAMKKQLTDLNLLLRILDSALCDFLDTKDSGTLCFCFRWLLIWFKREFSFQDILRLWEVLWTGLPCPNFHLLISCAILDSERDALMNSNYGFNEILKHINELTMKLNMEDILCRAEAMYHQLAVCQDLPRNVQEVLGLAKGEEKRSAQVPTASTPSSDTESSSQELLSSTTHESELTNSMSQTQADSSIEILPPEDADTTSQSISPAALTP
ncbi:TBC1 domain family member 17 [Protopterus annectens]|uniref:TBC1 domain family member 17 n=1 Tax=Protopterus annectens TaxID=7888 RepID=UPI001CFB5497|nr:TBC1 domain family member 17 [Protopterus annectens]